MHPLLDIRHVTADRYTYSLGACAPPSVSCEAYFDSAEQCLSDAGAALNTYFEDVLVSISGVSMGKYPVQRLCNQPAQLLHEFSALSGQP